mmetsp:Transcript_14565/g.29330  ORF Transcript_14565/g.29330 Transcript_14565/m.29330 type:complete len:106 (+) Transcript_14565:1-318(+)
MKACPSKAFALTLYCSLILSISEQRFGISLMYYGKLRPKFIELSLRYLITILQRPQDLFPANHHKGKYQRLGRVSNARISMIKGLRGFCKFNSTFPADIVSKFSN